MKHSFFVLALAICLCLFLAYPAGAAPRGAFALELDDGAVLVSADGQALSERGAYVAIERISDAQVLPEAWLFAGYVNVDGVKQCAILNAKGEQLTEPVYEAAYGIDGVVYVVKDGMTGALDASLKELVPCEYTQLVANGEGGFLALNQNPYDEGPDGVYYLTPNGEETATGIKVSFGLTAFSEGLMPVVAGNARMGYLGANGEWAVSAQYDYADAFQNGVAEAVINTGAGLIDRKGNWLVTPKYAGIEVGGGNGRMILAQEDSTEVLLLDPDTFGVKRRFAGEDIYVSAFFDANLAVLYLDDCTQLIDENGDVVMESGLEASFDAWTAMGERVVVRQGAWGEKSLWLCTLGGERLAGPYREMWLLSQVDGQALFAAADYTVLEEVDVDGAFTNYVEVEDTRLIEVIDFDGKRLIEPRAYINLSQDISGVLIFESKDQAGAIDEGGRTIAAFDKKPA